MGTLESIDNLIKFCSNLLGPNQTDEDCKKWIDTSKSKRSELVELQKQALNKIDPSLEISLTIKNATEIESMLSDVNDLNKKINLACKRALTDATPPKFCWRNGGTESPKCGEGQREYTYGLCYEKCDDKYEYNFLACRQKCDSKTEYNTTFHCIKKNNIFSSWTDRKSYTPVTVTKFSKSVKCPDKLPEQIGALCYRKCPPGTVNCGCCACSVNEATCGTEIIKMILSVGKGLLKLIAFAFTAGGSAAVIEGFKEVADIVFAVVEGVNSAISGIIERVSTYYESFLNNYKDETLAESTFKKFVLNIAYNKYLKPDLGNNINQSIVQNLKKQCEDISSSNWKSWKKIYEKKKTSSRVDKKELKEIFLENAANITLSGSDFMKLFESSNPNDLLKDMTESAGSIGSVGGTVLGLYTTIKEAIETKGKETDSDKIKIAKNVLGIMEIWDPTGITTIANAVLQPVCNDDPEYLKDIDFDKIKK